MSLNLRQGCKLLDILNDLDVNNEFIFYFDFKNGHIIRESRTIEFTKNSMRLI